MRDPFAKRPETVLAIAQLAMPVLLDRLGGSYAPLFAVAGAAYFLALLSIHILSPKLERAQVD